MGDNEIQKFKPGYDFQNIFIRIKKSTQPITFFVLRFWF